MQAVIVTFLVILAIFANAQAGVVGVLPTTTLVHTPSLDSAIIHSSRVGGSFAYSTAENHAYAAATPIIHSVVAPVAAYAIPSYVHDETIAYEPAVVIAK